MNNNTDNKSLLSRLATLAGTASATASKQASTASTAQRTSYSCLLIIDTHGFDKDSSYLPRLKQLTEANLTVNVIDASGKQLNLEFLRERMHAGGYDYLAFSHTQVLQLISGDSKAQLLDYAGSLFKLFHAPLSHSYWECLCLNKLNRLVSISYEPFIVTRYLRKLSSPRSWLPLAQVDYQVITNVGIYHQALEHLASCQLIAVDIETLPSLAIRCISYSGVQLVTGQPPSVQTWVLPTDSIDNVRWMRVINQLPTAKITQNGKYDISYLYLYNAVLTNWLWDTATAHHCWYAELPKKLDNLASFYIRDSRYWKGAHATKDLAELYEYAARDTHYTAGVFLAWLAESPQWAKDNYLAEFPVNYPAHVCEMTGIKLDSQRLEQVKAQKLEATNQAERRLAKLVGVPNFNCGSPKQVKALTKLLGNELASTSEKDLQKLANKHPLNKFLVDQILEIRGERKLISTYLKESIAWQFPTACPEPRILYSINPHGTDTGRNASKSHHFWVGLNIQNIPRGDTIKQIALAEQGWYFGEADYSQAETRGTGYITGEEKLLQAVEGENDFHSFNASAFFGTPYDQIYDNSSGKTLDKGLRDLSKRVNHGANYNMGATVLVDTMGEPNVYKAGRLLGLPLSWSADKIASYLLDQFDKTYPKVRNDYQAWVKKQIATTKLLVGATGWTRYCFGNPTTNKLDLNSYVAHCPQSLNAMIVNKAFMKVFYEVWLPNPDSFMLLAQIHDSILFQYRADRTDHIDAVARCMNIATPVTDISGKTRTLVVPTDIKGGGERWDGE